MSIIRALLGLILAFVLLILLARAIGSVQPLPEALEALHLTDCKLPCWLGITPGKTTFAEAVQKVIRVYPQASENQDGHSLDAAVEMGSTDFTISIDADGSGFVEEVYIYTAETTPFMLGDVVNLLGVPTCETDFPPSPIYGTSTVGSAAVFSGPSPGSGWFLPFIGLYINDYQPNPCFAS